MSTEQKRPAESLVQGLLAEKRELKVLLERARMELAETQQGSTGPDPRVKELEAEVERLRHQLAAARADVNVLREERDELRAGIEKAVEQITDLEGHD
jgi:chromosome segregation ATPase